MVPAVHGDEEEKPRIPCYVMRVKPKKEYAKSLRLEDVEIEIIDRSENYTGYIQDVLKYVRTLEEPDFLREKLNVTDVVPMGDYIRGFFGGLRRKHAGLTIKDFHHNPTTDVYHIKLANLMSTVGIPGHFIRDYWKKFIYAPRIFPFHLTGAHDVLLSDAGEADLRNFLRKHVLNSPSLSHQEKDMVRKLITELKQPDVLGFLNDKYYVIYRRVRAFAAVTLTPDYIENVSEGNRYGVIVSDMCAYAAVDDAAKAYYYSGTLNYLLYKMLEHEMKVARNQYARPLAAIVAAGLEWKGEDWQAEVAKLSHQVHGQAPDCYKRLLASGKKQVKLYVRKLHEASSEFKNLVELLDGHVDEERLRDALALVSG